MKKLALFIILLIAGTQAMSQSQPTLLSWEIDTLCDLTTDNQVINIQIEDLDMDSTWIFVYNYNATIYSFLAEDPAPPLVGGQTIRTFTIYGSTGTGIPAGLNISDIEIQIFSDNGADGVIPNDTIYNAAAYGDLGALLDLSTANICSNDQPVDLTPFASPSGGTFEWGDENNEGFMFDPVLYLEDPSNVTYILTNAAGCQDFFSDTPIFNDPPNLTLTPTTSTCGNADGSAILTISGGFAPWELYWSTGNTVSGAGTTENLTNLSSGTYYANVVNNLGCKETISARISDADVVITPTLITNANCSNTADGAIDITITATGTVTDIYWSTGAASEDITGLLSGEYAVEVHTDNNCSGYDEFYVSAPPSLDVDMVGTTAADCSDLVNFGFSSIAISTAGGQGPYMWDWNDGDYTTESLASIPSGAYKCKVTDANGCSLVWWMNLLELNGPQIYLEQIQRTKCGEQNGVIDVSIFDGVSPIVSTLWNNGVTSEDMVNANAGVYTVSVTDANGCVTKNRYKIPTYRPAQPQICLLTVDTSYTYNTVVWEKNVAQGDLAGFNVYRETSTVGEYELAAYRDYALDSYFQDNSASPNDRSWRYYITTVDTCGFESFPSFPHKTIHCVTIDQGPSKDVYWDDYEGINYTSVDLHRYDDVNGWVTIQTNYTGNPPVADTPPVAAGLEYLVTFNLAQTCTSSKAATDYNSSRSNSTSSVFDPGGSTLTIQDEEIGQITIYPNPTNDFLNVYLEFPDLYEFIEIRNVNGSLIYKQLIISAQSQFDMSQFANGVYFVRIVSEGNTINHKILKQ
jgi:Secretion system C-terminal sorting domain